jgi:hypothetical protein
MDDFNKLDEALDYYEARHGKAPDAIFVSSPLLCNLASSYLLVHWNDDKYTLSYHGIPIKRYASSDYEFYFAEGAYEV